MGVLSAKLKRTLEAATDRLSSEDAARLMYEIAMHAVGWYAVYQGEVRADRIASRMSSVDKRPSYKNKRVPTV